MQLEAGGESMDQKHDDTAALGPPQREPPLPPPPPVRRRRFPWLLLVWVGLPLVGLVWLAWSVQGLLAPSGLVERNYDARRWHGKQKIALIEVEGAILGGEEVKQQIDRVLADKRVQAVVLRVVSPGGTIAGSDFIYHYLSRMRAGRGDGESIPLVVSMGGIAASGGYYVSMAVGDTPNSIYAEPTTWTGSIGVIIPHYNIEKLAENLGIQADSIPSHPLKEMGTMFREMKPEERAILEALVAESFERFKQVIERGRPHLTRQQIDDLATGQIYSATQALELGLVDKLGYLEDAISRAIELAGLRDEDVQVVRYVRPPSLMEQILVQSKPSPRIDIPALLDAATPRAWYLCTWLPGVAPQH
jgi:protease-4